MAETVIAKVEKSAIWGWVAFGSLAMGGTLLFIAIRQSIKARKADEAKVTAEDEREQAEKTTEEVTLSANGMRGRKGDALMHNLSQKRVKGESLGIYNYI